jgi:hypothetical protein
MLSQCGVPQIIVIDVVMWQQLCRLEDLSQKK